MIVEFLIALLIGYFLGCISGGYFLGKLKGKDVRKSNVGNTGATSTYFVLGFKWSILAGLIDFLKGIAAMLIAVQFGLSQNLAYLVGAACIVGHNHPFYLRFKGGRGMAVFLAMTLFGLIYYRNEMSLLVAVVFIISSLLMGPRVRRRVNSFRRRIL
ncbi:MAG: glycerol-3-phosphate acyltransferase [bacterium]|nr:glycerol-3-phosphate acyltransferase [bacterium]